MNQLPQYPTKRLSFVGIIANDIMLNVKSYNLSTFQFIYQRLASHLTAEAAAIPLILDSIHQLPKSFASSILPLSALHQKRTTNTTTTMRTVKIGYKMKKTLQRKGLRLQRTTLLNTQKSPIAPLARSLKEMPRNLLNKLNNCYTIPAEKIEIESFEDPENVQISLVIKFGIVCFLFSCRRPCASF